MKRKTIAVCVTGYNLECETPIIQGIYKNCQKNNINILTFASVLRKPEPDSERTFPREIFDGEEEIFNLINYDILDGIIILGESLIEPFLIDKIADKAQEKNIPVVNINDSAHHLKYNISLSRELGMELILNHLIKDHGITKINFIGGFEDNLQTIERLNAYKKVLSENGLPFEEDRVDYGHFWKNSYDCTEKFINSGKDFEAIACANDTMAFFVMDCLKEHGYKIPEDVVVTGFDGVKDCEVYKPSLTTIRPGYEASGKRAVEVLLDVWEGKDLPSDFSVEAELIKNRSCGCKGTKKNTRKSFNFYHEMYFQGNRFKEFNSYILDMNTKFASAENSNDIFSYVERGANFFNLKRLYLCLCNNLESISSHLSNDSLDLSFKGLSDKMVCMISVNDDAVGKIFDVKKLIPSNIDSKKPCFLAFSPLYYRNFFLGYVAYEPSSFEGSGDFFATWLITISNNAGSFYMRNELEYVVNKLEDLNVRDPLTGLYNRRGMFKFSEEMVERSIEFSQTITVVCADIDNLKPINDIYGHEEGDNAIIQTANAIRKAMPESAVCVRTGGDEFCIIIQNIPDEQIQKCIENVSVFLDQYNEKSGLPYLVGASCGYKSGKISDCITLDDLIKLADAQMYRVKDLKKTNRK